MAILPQERVITDRLQRLAFGSDASFYRLIPELVLIVENEQEIARVLNLCRHLHIPVTFRGAGTSLCGQAISDSVLVLLGDRWRWCHIHEGAETVSLGPALLAGDANRQLRPLGRRIGPDPVAIDVASIGGIAARNASGMRCGTAHTCYRTVVSLRTVLSDGTVLDTGDSASRARFAAGHSRLLEGLAALAARVRADRPLAGRIADKYRLKSTTGYNINALVDFEDPFDILSHLLIGSEGTLGFLAGITLRTVPDPAHQASALVVFADLTEACRAVITLKVQPVAAVELMDRAALRAVAGRPGLPAELANLPAGAAALLIDIRAASPAALAAQTAQVATVLKRRQALVSPNFTTDPLACERLWAARRSLLVSVGRDRRPGTAVVIEDFAIPIPRLDEAVLALQGLLARCGYSDALIFGHALEGNLHFVFSQDFGRPEEIDRYRRLMEDLTRLVVEEFQGSLKAEHGTGRAMAPFLELEWGAAAVGVMREIKALFDPEGILNPGVILNDDKLAHLRNLKPMPAAHPLIDACTECGQCERICPSTGLTLTPRQRIVVWREICRLAADGSDPEGEEELRRRYDYDGIDTCSACGLCITVCPFGIDTGALIKLRRRGRRRATARALAGWVANHYGRVLAAARLGLGAAALVTRHADPTTVDAVGRTLYRLSRGRLPLWHHAVPGPAQMPTVLPAVGPSADGGRRVVYLPSCVGRTFGAGGGDPDAESLPVVTVRLLERAGFTVVLPRGLGDVCCGLPFESKGFPERADDMTVALLEAVRVGSRFGQVPVICDTSPCSDRLTGYLNRHPEVGVHVVDLVAFLHDQVLDRLTLVRRPGAVALHIPCACVRMRLEGELRRIAERCAETVVVPSGIACCGFAGDKGFTTPEINAHALRGLRAALPPLEECKEGYSASLPCEIGLSLHSGRPYRSIVHLLERCSRPVALPS